MKTMLKVLMLGIHEDHSSPKVVNIEPISSSVTLVQTEGKNILIDTGFYQKKDELLGALARVALTCDDIHYIINTHQHFDHCTNNYLFPKAEIVAFPTFWNYESGRVNYYPNYKLPFKDIELLYTPGHDFMHWSVMVRFEGKIWCLAGDGILQKGIISGKYPGFYNRKMYLESALSMLKKADFIVPGHGEIIGGQVKDDLEKRVKELLAEFKE